MLIPLFESIEEDRVVSTKDVDKVKPALREELAAVIINHSSPKLHLVFQLIDHLEQDKTIYIQQIFKIAFCLSLSDFYYSNRTTYSLTQYNS